MTTVEEHIAALRATGERMPEQFIRAGLLYELFRDDIAGEHYWYRPDNTFYVDEVRYAGMGRVGRPMVEVLAASDIPDIRGARMNYSDPPTEAELDWWMRANHYGREYLYPQPSAPIHTR